MKYLEFFHKIVSDPNGYAKKRKKEKKEKIVGYFCSYTPEEIISAAGASPFRIFGTSEDVSLADSHFQAYSCSLVKRALEDALLRKNDFLSGVVFPHACDSMQRLSDIWRMNTDFDFHIDIALPSKLNSESSRKYLVEIFEKFRSDMEKELNAEIGDEKLKKSMEKHDRIRENLALLYEIKRDKPSLISGSDIYSVFKASMIANRDIFLNNLVMLVKELEEEKEVSKENKKPIVVSGSVCNMPDIYKIMENSGLRIVADDLCTGMRYCEKTAKSGVSPIEEIATRYYEKIVCPAKHLNLFGRGEHIVDLVKKYNAKGVVFLFLKFCDPHSFDYPYIREMLQKENIPSMVLELENKIIAEGQFATRCEAFYEMSDNTR